MIAAEMLEELDPRFLGPKRWIYCYRPTEGGCPARSFLDNDLAREARASYAKSFEKHSDGHQLRGEKHRVWTERDCDGLYEYKDIQTKSRVVHITERSGLHILLFGFTGKKESKVDQIHVNRAKRLRDEYRQRRNQIEADLAKKASRGQRS